MKKLAEIRLRHHHSSGSAAAFLVVCSQRAGVVASMALPPLASGSVPALTFGDLARLAGSADLALPLEIDVFAVSSTIPPTVALPVRSTPVSGKTFGTLQPTFAAPSSVEQVTSKAVHLAPRRGRRGGRRGETAPLPGSRSSTLVFHR